MAFRTWMRSVWSAGLTLAAVTAVSAATPTQPPGGPKSDPESVAIDAAVRQALEQELDGNDAQRNAQLQHVLEQAPQQPQANWQIGSIQVGSDWLPYERVADNGERQSRLQKYQAVRAQHGDTVADHLAVANAARDLGLYDEERAHLRRIVALDRNHREARERLHDVSQPDGAWITAEDAQSARDNTLRFQQAYRTWERRARHIADELLRTGRRKRAEVELAALRHPDAIPAVEAALLDNGQEDVYVDWLSHLPCWEGSLALARRAIVSDSAGIRTRSQLLLRGRPMDHYVPILLDALRTDPDVDVRLLETSKRWLLVAATTSFETGGARFEYVNRIWYRPNLLFLSSVEGGFRNLYVGDNRPSVANNPRMRDRALQDALPRTVAFRREATPWAADVATFNARICRSLAAATQNNAPQSAQAWWDWWTAHNVAHVTGAKPLLRVEYEEKWAVDRQRHLIPSQDHKWMSCFAAGTPVVTETGMRPIESISVGDCVLSQDVETGELAFKPVLAPTVRPPTKLLRITTAQGELISTLGHPFWVNGRGWVLAHELKLAMRFHAVDGSQEVRAIEQTGREEPAYNLIVADFHTYFVGDGRILSHDNTPRAPTNALVPGLMPDYASAAADVAVSSH